MKIMGLQDNLSKVQAVEDIVQQVLRTPQDAQQLAASEVQKRHETQKRKVLKSDKKTDQKIKSKNRTKKIDTPVHRGKPNFDETEEVEERPSSIDIKV
ncbi:hypothetical protein KKA00_05535 [bacterium]|nr:hypothetical protein [bacterium]MBU1651659.1 hypothetical protein [bacterium]MBU1881214.1 hypothetical protein [bacterium]